MDQKTNESELKKKRLHSERERERGNVKTEERWCGLKKEKGRSRKQEGMKG